ncbi:MAG: ABC transporter ATP-binding protein [Rhodospirillaceae bacterium]|nr:ABC transporter ATP-binding protein [Rhodospirillaceae bacterium]MBT5241119.1 ABC transporter ATP-binding protein [Rhodospirillaceae bacterium]MBT5565631.1 ABC transporter ATP-binding protein [Rhodospirillaceae bacterium]MBT6090837.1 ABC transporter ATP-binding protein [Rhodospirillaceae bacterium]MBT6960032.1 ABC transporter ATP-binding protein [Rhodospirillaceae bacterium]
MVKPVVRIDDLRLEFLSQAGPFEALKGISLEIGEGEIVGVVGESGSGKSVTAMNLLQLLPRTKINVPTGTISVLDHDVRAMDEKQLQKIRGGEVAMIFQEPMTALNPVLRVKDQIDDVILRHKDVTPAEAEEMSLKLLADTKITDPRRVYESFPHELSGGMRQRVMIAMAFSCSPKLIVADEPTTALDVTVQAQILALLKERAKTTATSVLLITHDLAVVAQLCDRVYVMYKGEFVEQGVTKDVIGNPQHVYTRALLNSLPEGKAPKSRLATVAAAMIEGDTSNVIEEPIEQVTRVARTGDTLLQIKDAVVRYPKEYNLFGRPITFHTAVDHVSVEIKEGETLALVGESGCGKTSLANAVVGLNRLASGEIIYRDKNILDHEPEIRREIQIVFQDPQSSLDPRWPVWQIMTEPLTVGTSPSKAELREQAADLCEMVGLEASQIDRLPHEFSGGQRQRIAVGRALSVRPKLLVLDEPTSALDVSVQAQILNLLLDLQDEHGLTYLFISHDVAVVRHIADKVAVMYQSKVVEAGDSEQVLTAPTHEYTRTLMNAVPSLKRAFAA